MEKAMTPTMAGRVDSVELGVDANVVFAQELRHAVGGDGVERFVILPKGNVCVAVNGRA